MLEFVDLNSGKDSLGVKRQSSLTKNNSLVSNFPLGIGI